MRVRRSKPQDIEEMDYTPMIDIVFQLLTFFMMVITFHETEAADGIVLPKSELAKPPEKIELPLFVHMRADGQVIFRGKLNSVEAVKRELEAEGQLIEDRQRKRADVLVIVRADQAARTGKVQELIKVCQEARFEKFALRAEETH